MIFEGNYHGVLRTIFSFIQDNPTCLSFSRAFRNANFVFNDMLKKSSTHKHRLLFLNQEERKKNCTFDLYNPPPNLTCKYIIPKKYCQTIKEFEAVKEKRTYLQAAKTTNPTKDPARNKFNSKILSILATLNKTHGPVAMINGGFALRMFVKKKCCHPRYDRVDIDIFFIGPNILYVAKEFIRMFREINFDEEVKVIKFIDVVTIHVGKCKYRKIDLIIKEEFLYPNDVFCLIDLDCCKMGYFPGISKVTASIDFIRAIVTRENCFCLPNVSRKRQRRAIKYFYRLGIKTEFKRLVEVYKHGVPIKLIPPAPPHQMAMFHDFCKAGKKSAWVCCLDKCSYYGFTERNISCSDEGFMDDHYFGRGHGKLIENLKIDDPTLIGFSDQEISYDEFHIRLEGKRYQYYCQSDIAHSLSVKQKYRYIVEISRALKRQQVYLFNQMEEEDKKFFEGFQRSYRRRERNY